MHVIGNLCVEKDRVVMPILFVDHTTLLKTTVIHRRWEKTLPELHVAFGIFPQQEVSVCGLISMI